MHGFFQLDSPVDLLEKLEHDLKRVQERPSDPYPAFDFFVAAEHMLDWLYPGDPNAGKRREVRQSHPILQVVSHIATGAKHMIPEAPHHTSVVGTEAVGRAYGSGEYGTGAYGKGPLVIDIAAELHQVLGFKQITTLGLTSRVVDFWRAWPDLRALRPPN